MARFYPPFPGDFNGSAAEERVYLALQSLPERFRIFHSYHWSQVSHKKYRKEGEADFILFDPSNGILVIEVKGGGIEHSEGVWWQSDPTGRRQMNKDPWVQSQNCVYFLLSLLREREPQASIPIFSCLWFPDVQLTPALRFPTNIPKYAVLDRKATEKDANLGSVLESVWKSYKEETNHPLSVPTGFSDRLVEHLLPTLNMVPVGHLTAEESERLYLRLTTDQCKILEFIEDQNKVAIGGGAGSGKTIIAKEQALQLARSGEKTLFLVFNSALEAELSRSISHPNLSVRTWTKLAYEHVERNAPEIVQEELASKICEQDYNLGFKHVVIDEGQDFQEKWIQALDWTTDLHSGKMFVFYDNRQKIQGESDGLSRWILQADSKLTINRNCRNTAPIAKTAHAFLGEPPPKMLAEIPGPTPLWRELDPLENELLAFLSVLRSLLAKNYSPEEISLVTLGKLDFSVLKSLKYIESSPNSRSQISIKEDRGKGQILKTTVRKFKGLESQAVVVTDLIWTSQEKWDKANPEEKENLKKRQELLKKELYTAISRAKHEVVLFTKPLPAQVVWEGEIFPKETFRQTFSERYGLSLNP